MAVVTVDQLPELVAGVYPDVDETLYHQDHRALSQSGMKLILRSPAHFRWAMDHPPERKDAFDFGKAAHERVLGVGAELVVHVPDPKYKSPKSTNAWKDQQAEVEARDGVLLLPEEMDQVDQMAAQIKRHRLAMELLADGDPEVSVYARDRVTGVWMRGRFDWLGEKVIVDYKTADSSDPAVFIRKAVDYGYDLQAATYRDLAELVDHPATGFAHIVQEKKPPYVVSVVVLPAELIERGRILKRRAIERYRDCVEADEWPGYLPDDEFAQPAAPTWALREIADEVDLEW